MSDDAAFAALSASIESASADPTASLKTASTLLRNLLKDPASAKYRRLNSGNLKLQERLLGADGALELLAAVGFAAAEPAGWLEVRCRPPRPLSVLMPCLACALPGLRCCADSPAPPGAGGGGPRQLRGRHAAPRAAPPARRRRRAAARAAAAERRLRAQGDARAARAAATRTGAARAAARAVRAARAAADAPPRPSSQCVVALPDGRLATGAADNVVRLHGAAGRYVPCALCLLLPLPCRPVPLRALPCADCLLCAPLLQPGRGRRAGAAGGARERGGRERSDGAVRAGERRRGGAGQRR